MTDTFKDILRLIQEGNIVVSNHGYDELAEDSLNVREILAGVSHAVVIEEYPIRKDLAFWCCSKMQTGNPFMSFGAYQKAALRRQFW